MSNQIRNDVREITTHYDGHGLAEDLLVLADMRDLQAGNASHNYCLIYKPTGQVMGAVQFQHGPRNVEGSTPGILDSVLLAIVIDRMEGFQSGLYASDENALIKTHCEEALHWLKHRADERARRGVLGKNQS
jgi:hypothetical protein